MNREEGFLQREKNDHLGGGIGYCGFADKNEDCNRTTQARHDNAGASSHVKTQRGAARRKDGYWNDRVDRNCLTGLAQSKFECPLQKEGYWYLSDIRIG